MRRSTALNNVVDQQMGKQDPWAIDMDGVIGEFCVAKAMNVCPDLTIGIRKGGTDLYSRSNKTIDVKSTRVKSGRLLATLKKDADPCDVYVLAIVDDEGCDIAGWTSKEVLFDAVNIKDLGHGKGYVMDQDQLHKDINEIH